MVAEFLHSLVVRRYFLTLLLDGSGVMRGRY